MVLNVLGQSGMGGFERIVWGCVNFFVLIFKFINILLRGNTNISRYFFPYPSLQITDLLIHLLQIFNFNFNYEKN